MSYALEHLPWTEVARLIERKPRLILPVGALEQHGPHLPLGTNTIIAQRVATAVSEQTHTLCAPAFPYGATLGKGPFSGRSGLRRKTLHRAINELVARWEDHGVRHFVLISAHRFEPHLEALLMTPSGPSATSVYDLYQIDVSDVVDTDPELEHAGELETSLMLHLSPDQVLVEEMQDFLPEGGVLRRYTRRRVPTPPTEARGVLGAPSLASAKKGASIFDRYVRLLSDALEQS